MRNFMLAASVLFGVAPWAQSDIARPQTVAVTRVEAAPVTPPVMLLGTTVFGVCDDLAQGRVDQPMSRATSCCAKPACARLLSTVVLKLPKRALRT